jgi:hypothetical protein
MVSSLRDQTLDELLANVQELATVASRDQIRSVMAVIARCTIEIADQTRQLSEDVNQAKIVLGQRLTELTVQLKTSSEQASVDINGAKEAFLPAVAELVSELKRTHQSIDRGSAAASAGTEALIWWSKALVFVTFVYVIITGGLLWVSFMQMP